jgi:uncharacterized protein
MSAGGSRVYQASSAEDQHSLRDPAMDEILASIRRIISDDQRAMGLGEIQPSRVLARRAAEEAARPRLDDRDLQRLASIRARYDYPETPPEPAPEPPRATREAAWVPREDERLPLDDDGYAAREPSRPAEPRARPAPPPAPERTRAEPSPGLVSRSVDASVGHAFDALSASVATRAGRSLEEVVAEMLRPMLREWLETNLPNLVEQMVRSEIERVVRGGRRD